MEDYGDGGAFPEIQVAQYPLNMGKKSSGVRHIVPLMNAHLFIFLFSSLWLNPLRSYKCLYETHDKYHWYSLVLLTSLSN